MVEPAGTPKAPQHSNPASAISKLVASRPSGNPGRKLPAVVAWRNAWRAPRNGLSKGARAVLGYLAERMNPDGSSCYPSNATISAETGFSPRAVRAARAEAEAAGWLKSIARGRGVGKQASNLYGINHPKPRPTPAPSAGEGGTQCRVGRHPVPPSSSVSSSLTSSISPLPPAAPAAATAATASNGGGGGEAEQRPDNELQPRIAEKGLLKELEHQFAIGSPTATGELRRAGIYLATHPEHDAWSDPSGMVVGTLTRRPIFAEALHRVITGEASHCLFASLRYVIQGRVRSPVPTTPAAPAAPVVPAAPPPPAEPNPAGWALIRAALGQTSAAPESGPTITAADVPAGSSPVQP